MPSMLNLIDRETLAKLGIDDPEHPTLRVLITREDDMLVDYKVIPSSRHLWRAVHDALQVNFLGLESGMSCEMNISKNFGLRLFVDGSETDDHPVAVRVREQFGSMVIEAHWDLLNMVDAFPDAEDFRSFAQDCLRTHYIDCGMDSQTTLVPAHRLNFVLVCCTCGSQVQHLRTHSKHRVVTRLAVDRAYCPRCAFKPFAALSGCLFSHALRSVARSENERVLRDTRDGLREALKKIDRSLRNNT